MCHMNKNELCSSFLIPNYSDITVFSLVQTLQILFKTSEVYPKEEGKMDIERLNSSSKIVLGLSLIKDETYVIKSVSSLAKKTGAEVILVHCLKPFYSFTYVGDGTIYPITTYESILNEMDSSSAKEKLAKIQADFFTGIPCQTKISRGYTSDGIIDMSKEYDAALIVVGIDLDEMSSLSGMSTSITLMKRSPVPLLVVPANKGIDFNNDIGAIIADNLVEDQQSFLAKSYGFLRSIETKEIIQVHTKEVTELEMKRLVENIKTAMILGKIPDNENVSEENLKEKVKNQAIQKMKTNCRELLTPFEAKDIQFEVTFGKPAKDIQEISKRLHSNLIVFGRHHFFHKDSFSLGRVPWKSMLTNDCAILVTNS